MKLLGNGRRPLVALAGMAVAMMSAMTASLAAAPAADAAPIWGGDYAFVLAYEGLYPTQTPCVGKFVNVRQMPFTWNGRTGMLKLFYNGNCGAYIRADNMDPSCEVVAQRYSSDGFYDGWVIETSDGLTFAYTKMLNNLNGRWALGSLFCPVNPEVGDTIAWVGPY
jgi:hypothetical protein